ncbi:MAG: hypothetical protein WCR70_06680 [Sphaerochaetaceae bacterium]|jgi:ABC-2 type transport system permease protein
MTHSAVIASLVKAYFSGSRIATSLGLPQAKKKRSKAMTFAGKIGLGILLAISFGYMAVMLGFNFYSYQVTGQSLLGTSSLGFFMALVIDFVILLVFSLFSTSGIFYRTKENQLLMTLPITKSDLMISRLIISYLSFFVMHLFVCLPAIVVLFFLPFSLSSLLGALIFLVLSPLVPEAISAFLVTLSIRIGWRKNSRKGGELAFSIILILAIILVYGLGMRMMYATLMEDSASIMPLIELATVAMKYLAPMTFLAKAAAGEMSIGFVWYLLIFAGVCILAELYIRKHFFYCVSVVQNGGGATRKSSHSVLYKAQSPIISLYRREWTNLLSSSGFAFELFGETFIPVILIVMYSAMGIIGQMSEQISMISSSPSFPAIITAALLFMAVMNMCSSTSISRQGKYFYLDRSLPCDSSTFVKAKLLFHMVFGFAPSCLYYAVCVAFFKISPLWLAWMIPMSFLAYLVSGACGLYFDYKSPMLDWKTAQQAVKQNKNGLLGMGMGLAYILVQGAAYYFLTSLISPILGIIATLVIGACSSMLFLDLAFKQASKAYSPA